MSSLPSGVKLTYIPLLPKGDMASRACASPRCVGRQIGGLWGPGDAVDDVRRRSVGKRRRLGGDPAHGAAEVVDVQFGLDGEIGRSAVEVGEGLDGFIRQSVDEGRGEVVGRPSLPERIDQLLQGDVRDGTEQVVHYCAQLAEGGDDGFAGSRVPCPANDDRGDFLEVPLLGDERSRRGRGEDDRRAELVGCVSHRVSPSGDHVGGFVACIENDPTEHLGADRMQSELVET